MRATTSISIVIPARDEQENIGRLISEIHEVLRDWPDYEVVLVDDGSHDDTLPTAIKVARELSSPLTAVRHEYSTGQSGALQTGIRHARGELIITMDGDGQNDPADIPMLLHRASMMPLDDYCIAGYRRERNDSSWRRFQSRVANRIRDALLHDEVPDSGCGLKLFPRKSFLKLPWFDHGHRFIPALIRSIGGEVQVVETRHRQRLAGQSKYTAWNRTWSGIVDLLGVMWLLHRTRIASVSECHRTEQQ